MTSAWKWRLFNRQRQGRQGVTIPEGKPRRRRGIGSIRGCAPPRQQKGRCRVRDGDGCGPRDADRLRRWRLVEADLAVDVRSMTRSPPARQAGGLADVVVSVTAKAPAARRTGDSARRDRCCRRHWAGSGAQVFATSLCSGAPCLAPRRRHRQAPDLLVSVDTFAKPAPPSLRLEGAEESAGYHGR